MLELSFHLLNGTFLQSGTYNVNCFWEFIFIQWATDIPNSISLCLISLCFDCCVVLMMHCIAIFRNRSHAYIKLEQHLLAYQLLLIDLSNSFVFLHIWLKDITRTRQKKAIFPLLVGIHNGECIRPHSVPKNSKSPKSEYVP